MRVCLCVRACVRLCELKILNKNMEMETRMYCIQSKIYTKAKHIFITSPNITFPQSPRDPFRNRDVLHRMYKIRV